MRERLRKDKEPHLRKPDTKILNLFEAKMDWNKVKNSVWPIDGRLRNMKKTASISERPKKLNPVCNGEQVLPIEASQNEPPVERHAKPMVKSSRKECCFRDIPLWVLILALLVVLLLMVALILGLYLGVKTFGKSEMNTQETVSSNFSNSTRSTTKSTIKIQTTTITTKSATKPPTTTTTSTTTTTTTSKKTVKPKTTTV